MIISYVSDEVLAAILRGTEPVLDEAAADELIATNPNSAADGPGVFDQE
jgi:hypothetical protein